LAGSHGGQTALLTSFLAKLSNVKAVHRQGEQEIAAYAIDNAYENVDNA
jgi:hypothetical protein